MALENIIQPIYKDGVKVLCASGTCACGCTIELDDCWSNCCDKCGREYCINGWELAPRSQWGEETGETF